MSETNTLTAGKSALLGSLKPKKKISDLLKEQGIKGHERMDEVLIVLLDASGSMRDTMELSSKIDVAWRVLKHELMPNMTGWNYGVLIFQGWEDSVHWEIYPCQDTRALVILNTPHATGSTPMRQALEKAWQWVNHHAKKARFILLSDGCPTDSSDDNILNIAKENNRIPIDTVGIGTESGVSYNKEFLIELSRITGGTFVEASSAKQLATTILELAPRNRPLLGTVKEETS